MVSETKVSGSLGAHTPCRAEDRVKIDGMEMRVLGCKQAVQFIPYLIVTFAPTKARHGSAICFLLVVFTQKDEKL